MIVSKELLDKIKTIIDKHYSYLTLSVLGNSVFTPEELKQLQDMGVDTANPNSFLKNVYLHNLLNNPTDKGTPVNIKEMLGQQNKAKVTLGAAETYAVDHLNTTFKGLIDKLKQEVTTNMANVIMDSNMLHKFDLIAKPDKTEEELDEVKNLTLSKIKSDLRAYTGELGRNWDRIVSTEISNAIGAGSVDRIAKDNEGTGKDSSDIYVYRISVKDSKLCKFCKTFYVDSDGSPKVYRLSTILGNGTNYGKKSTEWLPVTTATHPHCRESSILELKPGWKLLTDGNVTFIGLEKWAEYIKEKVQK